MEYFNSNLTEHQILFISRIEEVASLIVVHDELKNEKINVFASSFMDGDFFGVNFYFLFREKASYQIEIFGNGQLMFRTKAKAI